MGVVTAATAAALAAAPTLTDRAAVPVPGVLCQAATGVTVVAATAAALRAHPTVTVPAAAIPSPILMQGARLYTPPVSITDVLSFLYA